MSNRKRIYPGDGDPRHGTVNGYQNLRCRCALCGAAWATYYREWRRSHPERLRRHADRERVRYYANRRVVSGTITAEKEAPAQFVPAGGVTDAQPAGGTDESEGYPRG